MKYIAFLIIFCSLLSCAAQQDGEFTKEEIAAYERAVAEYHKYSSMKSSSSWGVGNKWMFIYVKDDEIINRLIVEPTSEESVSWVYGDWKKLKVLFEQSPTIFEHYLDIIPAYEVQGRLLSLMMAANISHTARVTGRFDENGFVGSAENSNPYCSSSSHCQKPSVKVYGVPLF